MGSVPAAGLRHHPLLASPCQGEEQSRGWRAIEVNPLAVLLPLSGGGWEGVSPPP